VRLEVSEELSAATPSPTGEAGERRLVSVLFADLVGFTPFSESRDPEEVRGMLTRYFDRAQTIIEQFGGEVDKFIGDAVTAFWGAHQTQEDDADRAVRAALELIDSVSELGAEIGVPDLALRAGVLSGETSVGPGGNEKGLVVGDIVNTAARLQSEASPGLVFVGDSTHALTGDSIRYEFVGDLALKGKSAPVAVWRAVDIAAAVGGRGRADGLEAPFVGREDELRMLKDQIHATTREERARLVSIVGEAGIGKSRLAWELQKYLDGLTETFFWHEGRSPAYGEGVTFWALGEMVRQRARIAETDDQLKARTKLRTAVAEHVPDPDEQKWIEPRLAGLLGLDEMPPGDRNELFAALRTFFQRLAESSPTVLVFEDLHWADSGLLDFIEELVEWSSRHPIMVVTLARPDLTDQRPGWGSGRRNALSTHLGPLHDDDMEGLVSGLAPGIPDDVVSLIVGRAEGVPLYALEFVRMLLGSGDLAMSGDRFEMSKAIEGLAIPDSLRSVVAARLDRLDADQRSLILDASVLGYSFTADGLTIFGERANTGEHLRDLIRNELLEFEADEGSPERGQYRFIQSVIREVAYSRLARSDRRDRHVLVAEYYEARGDVETLSIVASHYVDAYAADPTDELAAATRNAVQRAAERAAELHSNRQVLALASRAIDLTPEGPDLAALHELAAKAAQAQLDFETAEEHAATALEWYASHGSSAQAATAAKLLGSIHTDATHPLQAIDAMLPFLDPEDTGPEQGVLAAALARAYMLGAQNNEGLRLADQAILIAESNLDFATLADAIITKATILPSTGRNQEGLMTLRGVIDFAEEHDLLIAAGRGINNLIANSHSDGQRMIGEYAKRGLEMASRSGDANTLQRMVSQRGWWLLRMHRLDEAVEIIESHEFDFEIEGVSSEIQWTRSAVDWLRDGAETAFAEMVQAMKKYLDSEERQSQETGKDGLAWMALQTGDRERALEDALQVEFIGLWLRSVETALTAALLLGDRDAFTRAVEYAETWQVPGRKQDGQRWAVLDGRIEDGVAAFTTLIELYDRWFSVQSSQEARLLFATVMGPDLPEARLAAETAYDEITKAGAHHLLEVWKDALPPPAVEAAG
jgi:class 3 adenylate cyclase/tetratricopeptide (TPR) repeat protein